MRRSNQIFLFLFLGISCFFAAIYFLGRSLVFLNLISTYGTGTEQDVETYETNLLLFGGFAFLSALFLALGISEWSSYQEVEKEGIPKPTPEKKEKLEEPIKRKKEKEATEPLRKKLQEAIKHLREKPTTLQLFFWLIFGILILILILVALHSYP